jgi:putative hydrolase of the HAD superfamily
MNKRTRAVYFDVGDTLVHPGRALAELLLEVAGDLGIAVPAVAFARLGDHMRARVTERTRLGRPFTYPPAESRKFWMETYQEFLSHLLREQEASRLARAVLDILSSPEGYELFDDVLPTLRRLREDGFRLGIVSNWESWLPQLLERAEVAPLLDHVVISGMCGIEKPDPGIFVLALREAGLGPEQTFYVGDNPEHDVAPPLLVGITPVLLDRCRRYPPNTDHPRIASLHELPSLLNGISTA